VAKTCTENVGYRIPKRNFEFCQKRWSTGRPSTSYS